jgi:hypothetical protein
MSQHWYVPRRYIHKITKDHVDDKVKYHLNNIQRVFVLLEHPDSCILSMIITCLIGVVIVVGILSLVISTSHKFQQFQSSCQFSVCDHDELLCPDRMVCRPQPFIWCRYIDFTCVITFTVIFVIRLLTCWSVTPRLAGLTRDSTAEMSPIILFLNYFATRDNFIDLCAIVPFYVYYGFYEFESKSTTYQTYFVKILWIPRMFRLVQRSKYLSNFFDMADIFLRTLMRSLEALAFTYASVGMAVVVVGCLYFEIERGTYKVNDLYPEGAYIAERDVFGNSSPSDFRNVFVTIYFIVVATTTLGFGDFSPHLVGGITISSFLSFLGIIVLTFPIAAIGHNFVVCHDLRDTKNEKQAFMSEIEEKISETDKLDKCLTHERKCKILEGTITLSLSLTLTLTITLTRLTLTLSKL